MFVQNLAPGAAARLGLDADTLRAENPRLIHVSISGYGPGGPYSAKKAYDLLVQCEAGLVSITGTEEEPSKVGISIADIASGMYAYSGILTALIQRERTGEGVTIEISMLEALAEWMGISAQLRHVRGTPPARTGARHAAIAPYGPFRCGDGKQVFLGIQNEREWATFCERILGDPQVAEDPRFVRNSLRVEHSAQLQVEIERSFATKHGRGGRRPARGGGQPAQRTLARHRRAGPRTRNWQHGEGGSITTRRSGRCVLWFPLRPSSAVRRSPARFRKSGSILRPSWRSSGVRADVARVR